MFLLHLENLAAGWDIMWRGMAGIFAAIAVIVFVVWAFTKIGNSRKKDSDGAEQ